MALALILLVQALAVDVGVELGSYYREEYKELLSGFLSQTTDQEVSVSILGCASPDSDCLYGEEYDFIIDYSGNLFNSQNLARSTKVLTSSVPPVHKGGFESLYEDPAQTWTSQIAISLALKFEWSSSLLITDETTTPLLGNDFDHSLFQQFSVSSLSTDATIHNLISRVIRASGIRSVFLMTRSPLTNRLLSALAKLELDAGYAIVVIGNSCLFDFSLYPTGVLCTTLKRSELASSMMEVDFWYLLYAMNGQPLDSWTLVNVVNGVKMVVGLLKGTSLSISAPVVFPGGLTSPPSDEPFAISICLNNYVDDQTLNTQRAYSFALADTPLASRKFKMKAVKLEECSFYSPTSWYMGCYLAAKLSRASVLISSDATATLVYQVSFLKQLQLQVPFISSLILVDQLSSSSEFPFFTRLNQTYSYYTTQTTLVLKKFKWYEIHIFYASDLGKDFGDNSIKGYLEGGIKVATPIDQIPIDASKGAPEYERAVELFKSSDVRTVCFMLLPPMVLDLMQTFYEAGIRARDVTLSTVFTSYQTLSALATPRQLQALEEFRPSYLGGSLASYSGELGDSLKQRFKAAFGIPELQDCMAYDAVTQTIHAADFSIRRGLNFNDWRDMSKAIRSVRFIGCIGEVQQSFEYNDIKDSKTTTGQYYLIDGKYEAKDCLVISLSGTRAYTELADFVWADGTNKSPKSNRFTYDDCPFPEEYRRDSPKGHQRAIIVNFSITAASFIATVLIYCFNYRNDKRLMKEEPFLMGTQDKLFSFSLLIDPACIYLINPSGYTFLNVLSFKRNIDRIDFSDGNYFNLLNFLFVLTALWTLASFSSVIYKYKPLWFEPQLMSSMFIRIFSFTLILGLMATYQCSEGNSENGDPELTESVMDVDCYSTCWEGKHLTYSVLSVVALGMYLLVSILYSEPICNLVEGLQFRTHPHYLLFRLPMITALIAIHVADLSLPLGSALYFSILSVFLGVCWRFRVTDVPSLTLYHNCGYLAVLLLSLGHVVVDAFGLSVGVSWALGVSSVCSVSVILLIFKRKLPTLILPEKRVDTALLFAFAFRPRSSATDLKAIFPKVHEYQHLEVKSTL